MTSLAASSRTNTVLEDATTDLKNAEFPGYLGKLFNPIRDTILVPVASKARDIVPRVAQAIPLPFLDESLAFVMGLSFGAVKLGYKVFPHPEVDTEQENAINRELMELGNEGMKLSDPNPILSSLKGVVGFAVNSIIDLATLPLNGKLREWIDMTIKFFGYLIYTGVGKDMMVAFGNPRGVENLLIIGNVQEERTYIRRLSTVVDVNIHTDDFKNIMKDAARYVRFATAAYGASMIDSADLLQVYGRDVIAVKSVHNASERSRKNKIAGYVGVNEDNILKITPPGANIKLLGHFVAVDHRRNAVTGSSGAVVLAVRGTYTLSGLKIDAEEAFSKPFCAGVAHSGIAERAVSLWVNVKVATLDALKKNPGYDLVITGHSLGAGAAALLALKLNYEKSKPGSPLEGVKVKCFAYAPPPVYFQTDKTQAKEITEAMKNTHAFIHQNDCVPFLSVDGVRRLTDTVTEVDRLTLWKPVRRTLMAAGIKVIPQNIVDVIAYGSRDLPPVANAKRLAIPAPFVMWMRRIEGDEEEGRPAQYYDAKICRPQRDSSTGAHGINDLCIMVDWDMISDHMNPQYELAVNSVLAQMIRQ